MGKEVFCKLIANNNQTYYLLTNPHEGGKQGIDLTLTNARSSWTGQVSRDDLRSLSEKVNMHLDDFTVQTLKALTQQNMGDLTFQYDVKDLGSDKQFVWKKVMTSEQIKFQLGCVCLNSVEEPEKTTQHLYNHSIELMKDLNDRISTLEKNNERLSTERRKAVNKLDQCVTVKEELEKDLFSKFQVIINTKKAKIRQLQDEIKNAKPHENTKPTGETKLQEEEEEDDDEESDDEEMDTDEEIMNLDEKQKKKSLNENITYSRNDSLLLDDDVDEDLDVAPKRRRRQTVQKQQSGPAVSLPSRTATQVQSSTTPSVSRNPQKTPHRSGSTKANTSDADMDGLFDQL